MSKTWFLNKVRKGTGFQLYYIYEQNMYFMQEISHITTDATRTRTTAVFMSKTWFLNKVGKGTGFQFYYIHEQNMHFMQEGPFL